MTKQTWTALVAGICFAACVLVAAVVPVPFVIWSAGPTSDLLATGDTVPVTVTNATNYPTTGRLLVTTVSQTRLSANVSLLEALYSYWAEQREVQPRSAVFPAGVDESTLAAEQATELTSAQEDAAAAALRAAGIKVDPVPVVAAVNAAGPSAGKLLVRDVVIAIRYTTTPTATAVQTAAEASTAIASGKVGDQIMFSIVRDGVPQDVLVTTQSSKTSADQPVAGVSFVQGFRYAPEVTFKLDPSVVGSGSGLMFALAIYDKVTPDALLKERIVAGSGSIDANGAVSRVAAIREKVVSAERAGASVFLLPAANCAELAGQRPTVRLVPVATLAEAVDALGALSDTEKAKTVKGCP